MKKSCSHILPILIIISILTLAFTTVSAQQFTQQIDIDNIENVVLNE